MTSVRGCAHNRPVESPDPLPEAAYAPEDERPSPLLGSAVYGVGELLAWVAGLVLALSAFTGWYTGEGEGVNVAVLAWDTGMLGKLVFFIGVAAVALAVLRVFGIEPPAAVPESLIVLALGAIATVSVLVRMISIPDEFFFAGRGIGIWISLVGALGLIVAGLLQASEEL
jgi:hypothetical protein